MRVNSFEDLVVWQKSMDLVAEIYRLLRLLPKEELYSLSSQMRRAAISIPSNIAEGQQRDSIHEYIHFLTISRGSCGELLTQLMICNRLDYLSENETGPIIDLTRQVNRMLTALITGLKNKM
ncbi:MAG: four helix bundle protein [Clostridia bacterium]|nr:four helix bundle protein [Clostridia bacterium]